MEDRIKELERNMAALAQHMKTTSATISQGFSKVDGNFEKITSHLNNIDTEISGLHKKVDVLSGTTDKGLGDVNVKLEDLKGEISKINDVTQYDDLYKNLKIVG